MIPRTFLAAVLAVLLLPASAAAHAVLERTDPARGAELQAQPEQVAFFFNEPVESAFGSLRVFDSAGQEVQSGEISRPDGDSSIAVGLEPELPDGTYTATYRVVSADSHPISGGFVFSIGRPGATTAPLADLLERQGGVSGTSSPAFVVVRWLGYVATALAVGALAFLLAVGLPALRRRDDGGDGPLAAGRAALLARSRTLILAAAGAGVAAALLSLPLQIAAAADVSFIDALDGDYLSEVLDTRFGLVAALRAGAFALLAAVVIAAVARRGAGVSRPGLAIALLPAGFLLAAPALSGHAATQDLSAVLLPADIVHVAAMTAWLGGLAALLLAVPTATRGLEGGDRASVLSAALERFSPIALASVVALAVTGVVQAVIELGELDALVHTGFGRAILVKATLLVLLAFAGWLNRSRLMPAIAKLAGRAAPGEAGRRLRANLRLEVAGIAAVLVAAAKLVGYAPPADSAPGPASGTATLGESYLEYTVEPASVGSNEVHLYLFDAADGSQVDPREMTASASLPSEDIGPLELDLRKAGPGHYVAPAAAFGIAGDWTLEVAVRESRFDQPDVEIDVPIE